MEKRAMQKPFNVEVGSRRNVTGTYEVIGEGYDDRTIRIRPEGDDGHIDIPVDAGLVTTDNLVEFYITSALRNYTGAAEDAVEVPTGTIAVHGGGPDAKVVDLSGRARMGLGGNGTAAGGEHPGFLVQAINHQTDKIEALEKLGHKRRWYARAGFAVGLLGFLWVVLGDRISAWIKMSTNL